MKRRLTAATCCSIVLTGCGAHEQSREHADAVHTTHWEYDGASGPSTWGSLDSAFRACGRGTLQSPIDISSVSDANPPAAFHTDWRSVRVLAGRNGHTVQATVEDDAFLELLGERYRLLQFHYHHPSEHSIDGRRSDVELHLVHATPDNRLAVVGVLFDVGEPTDSPLNALIRGIAVEGDETAPVDVDLSALGAQTGTYYSYDGSLTTPPCTEGVKWIVLGGRRTLSAEQFVQLQGALPVNARSAMPLGDRRVLVNRAP